MANFKPLPPVEELRKRLDYNPKTGKLYRLKPCRWTRKVKSEPIHYQEDPAGYRRISVCGKNYPAHRIIWKWVHGEDPNIIDHINGRRDDNRLVNLRSVTHQENARNSARALPKSGFTGIHYKRGRAPRWKSGYQKNELAMSWRVYVTIYGKSVEVFRCNHKADAIKARDEIFSDYGYHPNHGRKPRRLKAVEEVSYLTHSFPGESNTWGISWNMFSLR